MPTSDGEALDARELHADETADELNDGIEIGDAPSVNGYDLYRDEFVGGNSPEPEWSPLTNEEMREILACVRHLNAALVYVQENAPAVVKGMQENPMLAMMLKGFGLG